MYCYLTSWFAAVLLGWSTDKLVLVVIARYHENGAKFGRLLLGAYYHQM